LNRKFYNIFNYSSLILVLILLILMLTKAVPVEWFVPIASFAILLLIVRIFLRISMSMKERSKLKE